MPALAENPAASQEAGVRGRTPHPRTKAATAPGIGGAGDRAYMSQGDGHLHVAVDAYRHDAATQYNIME
jgi:hypothetical protein